MSFMSERVITAWGGGGRGEKASMKDGEGKGKKDVWNREKGEGIFFKKKKGACIQACESGGAHAWNATNWYYHEHA